MQNKNMRKSIFSLFIVFAMIFSMLPVSAFAADDAQDALTELGSNAVVLKNTGDDNDSNDDITDSNNNGGLLLTGSAATPASTSGLLLTGGEDDPDALLECDCEVRCTEEEINADCPVCINNPEWCVVGVEPPEIAALASVNYTLFLKESDGTLRENDGDGNTLQVGDFTGLTVAGNSVSGYTLTLGTGFNFTTDAAVALEVPSGTTINVTDDAAITCNGSTNSTGIKAGTMLNISVLSGKTLTVTTGNSGTNTTGIIVEGIFTKNGSGKLEVTAGDSTSGGQSHGIYAKGNFNMNLGEIDVIAGGAATSYGIRVNGGTFNMNDGDVIADSGTSTIGDSCGIFLDSSSLVMNNGTLEANGTDTTGMSSASYGIFVKTAGSFTMKNGELNANSGEGKNSFGIYVEGGSFTMENGELNADADEATTTSTGIYVDKSNFTMSGGTLTATGDGGTASSGIQLVSDTQGSTPNVFTMSGGTIYANSDETATTAASVFVLGNLSVNGITIKGYDGNEYTVDASFVAPPETRTLTIYLIKSSAGADIFEAKLYKDAAEPEPEPEPEPQPRPQPSSGSSSSGGSSRPAPAAPVIAPLNEKMASTMNNAIDNAVKSAANSSTGELKAILKNVSVITKENVAALIKKASQLGKKATVSSDIMSEDGTYVEVRVTLDPTLIAQDVRLDGYTRQAQTLVTQSKFTNHFENKIAVIGLGQQKAFGQAAKISAKLDLNDFDQANLFLYSYNKKANKYTLITSKNYKIDKNGYLVFDTHLGGDIIVSNGRLEKKQG